jgi:hypothetical protein
LGWEQPLDAFCINDSYAQKATFAKSRERPKITARVGPARCDAASPKQTLIRRRSIIEVLRSAQRDFSAIRCNREKTNLWTNASIARAGSGLSPHSKRRSAEWD